MAGAFRPAAPLPLTGRPVPREPSDLQRSSQKCSACLPLSLLVSPKLTPQVERSSRAEGLLVCGWLAQATMYAATPSCPSRSCSLCDRCLDSPVLWNPVLQNPAPIAPRIARRCLHWFWVPLWSVVTGPGKRCADDPPCLLSSVPCKLCRCICPAFAWQLKDSSTCVLNMHVFACPGEVLHHVAASGSGPAGLCLVSALATCRITPAAS